MTTTDELLPHMRKVQAAERDMRELGLVWQTIESAAAISCPEEVASILPTLSRTRERFGALQLRLVESLASESRAELGDELAARARCTIDILVRNLFERTADVGFLATDDVIRGFCAAGPEEREAGREALRVRLAEYQSKYTVYEDVVVLSTEGEVLVRLDTAATLTHSAEPLVAEALGADGFRERFGPTDLVASGLPALLYAHRITHPDGRPLGALVLVFRFVDEMRRIFAGMDDERGQTAIVLVDEAQRVIASNDEAHIPIGALLPRIEADGAVLTTFAGREYMAVCCATRGYQGYMGLPWRAQAMVSLLTAFRPRSTDVSSIDVPLDNDELTEIQRDADEINRELRRVVWNGQLMAHSRQGDRLRLKAVLNEVNVAGYRTRERVSLAVRDLYRTSLARARHQASDLARLAADIMDRNLYERANDCRWWALSPAIAERLSEPPSERCTTVLNGMLDRLNALYTVYSRIAVFDAEGTVRGVSRASDAPGLVGRQVESEWLEGVRRLQGPQQYAVTAFGPTDFHDLGDTYVYLAAIRDPQGGALLGGIGIVFNSAAEFGAMLTDIVGTRRGFAAFVDGGGRVIAASDPALATGIAIEFDGDDAVVSHDGSSFACARVRTAGYREFKRHDGYDNGVRAVVGLRLGQTDRRRRTLSEEALKLVPVRTRDQVVELGVFQVGAARYAIPAERLMQAVSHRGLVRAPSALSHSVGLLELNLDGTPRLVQVICARQLFGVTYPARVGDGVVMVLQSASAPGRPVIGLRVDDVLSVLEVEAQRVQEAPAAARLHGGCVTGIVDCELAVRDGEAPRGALVQVLDVQALLDASLGALKASPVALTTPLAVD
ncbi:MAG: chemotaxis protein CheW [Burkholderiales bacterium]